MKVALIGNIQLVMTPGVKEVLTETMVGQVQLKILVPVVQDEVSHSSGFRFRKLAGTSEGI